MPVPKRKTTRSNRGMRRQQHDRVAAPHVVPCANCSAPVVPHRACSACGFYRGRQVLSVSSETPSTTE